MAVHELQTQAVPFYEITVPLQGQSYKFEFRYNQREGRWYFSMSLNGDDLVSGVKVVCRVNLLYRAADTRLPPGVLMALSQEGGDSSPPGLEELGVGRRVTLTYFEMPEELRGARSTKSLP